VFCHILLVFAAVLGAVMALPDSSTDTADLACLFSFVACFAVGHVYFAYAAQRANRRNHARHELRREWMAPTNVGIKQAKI
jgi:hypothetical protein